MPNDKKNNETIELIITTIENGDAHSVEEALSFIKKHYGPDLINNIVGNYDNMMKFLELSRKAIAEHKKGKSTMYEWLYKAWYEQVESVKKLYRNDDNALIKGLSDDKILEVILSKFSAVNPVSGSITVCFGPMMPPYTHNVFQDTYKQLILYVRAKAVTDWDECQKSIDNFGKSF